MEHNIYLSKLFTANEMMEKERRAKKPTLIVESTLKKEKNVGTSLKIGLKMKTALTKNWQRKNV